MQIRCPECQYRFEVDPVVPLPSFRVRCSQCATRAEVDGRDGRVIRRVTGISNGTTVSMRRPADRQPTPGGQQPQRKPPAYLARVLAGSGSSSVATMVADVAPVESGAGVTLREESTDTLPPPWHADAPESYGAWTEKRSAPVAAVEVATDPELSRFRRELRPTHVRVMAQDPHGVLGVTRQSTRPEIMKAYLAASENWRPSVWVGRLSSAELDLVREIAARLDSAFNDIGQSERRASSRHLTPPPVAARIKGHEPLAEDQPTEVEMLFAQGKEAMARGYFGDAVDSFERCVRLDDSVALYHLRLGQVALRKESLERGDDAPPPEDDRVKPHFERALELEPESIEVLLGYGHFLKARGKVSRAMRYFKEVRDQDPKHHEARREIRLYLSRKRRGAEATTTAGKLKKMLTTKI